MTYVNKELFNACMVMTNTFHLIISIVSFVLKKSGRTIFGTLVSGVFKLVISDLSFQATGILFLNFRMSGFKFL